MNSAFFTCNQRQMFKLMPHPDSFTVRWLAGQFALVGLLCLSWATTATARQESQKSKNEATPQQQEPVFQAFKVGDFTVKDFRPIEHEHMKLLFTVYVEVPQEQAKQFAKQWTRYEHRIREQIITAARLISTVEYDEPELKSFRHRIHLRLRRAFPELPIEGVFLTDFSYLQL